MLELMRTIYQLITVLGWLLTYLLPLALIANGTANQGDDSPWAVSFFVLSPLILLGLCLLLCTRRYWHYFRWMGLYHILSILLGIIILPQYWQNVTFNGSHIASGMSDDYIDSFEPEVWHYYWAPLLSFYLLTVTYITYQSWKSPRLAE